MFQFLFFWIEYFDNTGSNDITTYSINSDLSTRFIQGQVSVTLKQNSNFIFMNAVIYF